MLLYHGTTAENVKSIRRKGLVLPTNAEWQRSFWSEEIGLPPSTFMSTQPRSGRDSDPLEFAKWNEDSDGYIVVIRCSWNYLAERLRGIWSTWDVMFYLNAWSEAINTSFGVPLEERGDWGPDWDPYEWVKLKRPDIAEVLLPNGRFPKLNPEWLLARRLERPTEDCQVVAGPIEPVYILDIVRVYDCRSGRLVPEFDPKRQTKLKHKNKSFASLFRHYVLSMALK